MILQTIVFNTTVSSKLQYFGVLDTELRTKVLAQLCLLLSDTPSSLQASFKKNRASMVSKNQSAFIKGRFIQDNIMLVQQTARFLHSQNQPTIMLKLDISKAFDSVSWPFLLEVLRSLGFGAGWCDIVSGLLATSSSQILLNGIPGDFIPHRRGLRQGDPLSPMLFILVMDVLNLMVGRAVEAGLLQPLSTRSFLHRVSLYAEIGRAHV